MYRKNRGIPRIRNEEEKGKSVKNYFSTKDDTHIINSIIRHEEMGNNDLPDVWCLDFKRDGKSKKRVGDRRDLILDFCTEIEQHFTKTDRNTILPELISLLTTYDLFATELHHKKNLSDACRQLLTKDFANYSSLNIENILKNLKLRETNEMTEGYTDPITMFFTEDALEKDMNKYLKFEEIDPDELDREFAKFEQEELNFDKNDCDKFFDF